MVIDNNKAIAEAWTREIGAQLREARIKRKMSQSYLAELAGMKQQSIARIEAGTNSPSVGTVGVIISALGMTLTIHNPKTIKNNKSMEKKLFKTRKDAEKYIDTNFDDVELKDTAAEVEFFSDWDDAIDNAGGQVPAVEVSDSENNTLAYIGWWEEGDQVFEIFGDGKLLGTYDNIFDARHAAKEASYNYDDDDQVTIKVDGEPVDWN